MSDGSNLKLEEARTNNVLSATKKTSDAQNEYYTFLLRKEKVEMAKKNKAITTDEQTALEGLSELDQLELKALARLYKLADNSPELLQYGSILHCSTREEMATKLATKQLRKQLVEEATNKILTPTQVAGVVKNTLDESRRVRSVDGFGLAWSWKS